MEKRPNGRDKRTSSGSVNVGKGSSVGGGSPLGTGGRKTGSSGRAGSSSSGGSNLLGGLLGSLFGSGSSSGGSSGGGSSSKGSGSSSFKTIIILVLVGLALFFLFKKCGGENSQTPPANTTVSGTEVSADENGDELARDYYTVIKGSGKDTITVMVYMCGTDLESKHGMATSDLNEMKAANISDKVNVIVETGGCKSWRTSGISNDHNQIYRIRNHKLECLVENNGKKSMTDSDNLASFIQYCTSNYPANRYILVMWDHGGGSLSGFGYDERVSSGSMTLTNLNAALQKGGCKFDLIGFDACLMSTLETALVCDKYADYLIASEEVEPGTGWYHTDWLNVISKNTSTSTVNIAKTIIDTYIASNSGRSVTLSVTDLAELHGAVPEKFNSFATSTAEMVKSDNYAPVSDARASVRQFSAKNKINQVDIVDLAQKIGTDESLALASALKGCVKYNGTTMSNCYGLSIYFPYESLSNMNSAVSVYNNLGLDSDYVDCIKSFASLETAGQTAASTSLFSSIGGSDMLGSILNLVAGGSTSSSSSPLTSLLGTIIGGSGSASAGTGLDLSSITSLLSAFSGKSMPSGLEFVDTELVSSKASSISSNLLDPSHLTATDKNGTRVLKLTDEEWALIQTAEISVYVEDGNGFIDLGHDNTIEFDEDGDLIMEFDGTWLCLDGHPVAYYLTSSYYYSEDDYEFSGYIPALLNGETVDIEVLFTPEHNYGIVTGARPVYGNETDTAAKGCIEINKGDIIQPLCDYYGKDGEYEDSYTLGSSFSASAELRLDNIKVSEIMSVCFRITDIYGNVYFTPAFTYDGTK
ncbi:MAG: peptidase C11 [Clostridia bacterium]|nr:peptidase C11 [Clostridia bacterium]